MLACAWLFACEGDDGNAPDGAGAGADATGAGAGTNGSAGAGVGAGSANAAGAGGSGGAIYNDGNTMTLSLCGVRIQHNEVVQHGSAIFFVSNDHSGDIAITDSTITDNVGGSWYPTTSFSSNVAI